MKNNFNADNTNSVRTKFIFPCTPDDIWKELLFYESMSSKKPLLLKMLLPIPIRNEGHITKIGDETLCLYHGGHLRKRLTKIVDRELYQFEITEQRLKVKFGIKLSGGAYCLKEMPDGKTELTAVTNYTSHILPRFICRPIEAEVCHWFHRYLLHSINKNIHVKHKQLLWQT